MRNSRQYVRSGRRITGSSDHSCSGTKSPRCTCILPQRKRWSTEEPPPRERGAPQCLHRAGSVAEEAMAPQPSFAQTPVRSWAMSRASATVSEAGGGFPTVEAMNVLRKCSCLAWRASNASREASMCLRQLSMCHGVVVTPASRKCSGVLREDVTRVASWIAAMGKLEADDDGRDALGEECEALPELGGHDRRDDWAAVGVSHPRLTVSADDSGHWAGVQLVAPCPPLFDGGSHEVQKAQRTGAFRAV